MSDGRQNSRGVTFPDLEALEQETKAATLTLQKRTSSSSSGSSIINFPDLNTLQLQDNYDDIDKIWREEASPSKQKKTTTTSSVSFPDLDSLEKQDSSSSVPDSKKKKKKKKKLARGIKASLSNEDIVCVNDDHVELTSVKSGFTTRSQRTTHSQQTVRRGNNKREL